jgi:hypothetical protein
MVVLVIIATMVTVVLPYASRSNEAMEIRQESLSLAESVMYAIETSSDTQRPTRIAIDSKNNCYFLEIANGINNNDFKPIEGIGNAVHYFGSGVRIIDMTGLTTDGSIYHLTFEPANPWPNASVSFSSGELIRTVKIRGKRVEIEDSTI